MRAILRVSLSFFLAASAMSASPVFAQDDAEFDEFEDEFEDDFEGGEGEGEGQAGGEGEGEGEQAADDETPPEAAAAPTSDEEVWGRRFRTHNTWFGPTGGVRLVDANVSAVR